MLIMLISYIIFIIHLIEISVGGLFWQRTLGKETKVDCLSCQENKVRSFSIVNFLADTFQDDNGAGVSRRTPSQRHVNSSTVSTGRQS